MGVQIQKLFAVALKPSNYSLQRPGHSPLPYHRNTLFIPLLCDSSMKISWKPYGNHLWHLELIPLIWDLCVFVKVNGIKYQCILQWETMLQSRQFYLLVNSTNCLFPSHMLRTHFVDQRFCISSSLTLQSYLLSLHVRTMWNNFMRMFMIGAKLIELLILLHD